MFELLFKYPAVMFQKGEFVFGRSWPVWLLVAGALAAATYAASAAWRARNRWAGAPYTPAQRWLRPAILGTLCWSALALLLLMLWQPALSVSSLKPRQNVVAVVVDSSRSMALPGQGTTRIAQARNLLDSGLLADLKARYPVRIYAAGADATRVETPSAIEPVAPVTRLGASLAQVAAESATLPIGAVVLLTDGSDNSRGFDRSALSALKQARIPVHAVGFGPEALPTDIEILTAGAPARALPGSRIPIMVRIRHSGFDQRQVKLTASSEGKSLATRQLTLPASGQLAAENITITAGKAGAMNVQLSVEPLGGELSPANNSQSVLVQVEDRKPRILYFEGEPRWELKFIRRAAEEDKTLELASLLRTTQNKFYRQGIASPAELVNGFPSTVEEILSYDGLIIGAVEAGAFTPTQLSLIKAFADRRGGGVLFLGGRTALSDGAWHTTDIAEMLPVSLSRRKDTFSRNPVKAELTQQGALHDLTRLDDSPQANAARWRALPPIADFQQSGPPKPAALVLLEAASAQGRQPLLAVQPFGRGRVAMLSTGGTWKWQMLMDARDQSHEQFWKQMLRWLVSESRPRIAARVSESVLNDAESLRIDAEVFDPNFLPTSEATVEARITQPGGGTALATLQPDPVRPGRYTAGFKALTPGAYVAQISARLGDTEFARDELMFRRQDGVAEAFHPEQDRPLLEHLASQTGGKYWTPESARDLPKEIEFSEAGLSVRELHDLWDSPFAFLLLIGLKAAEWLLRRRWGAV